VERPAAEQPHPALAVAHASAGHGGDEGAGRPVREAAHGRHRPQVAEPVADHEVGAGRRGEERRHGCRWVLAVPVEHDHRLGWCGTREQRLDRGREGVALAAVAGQRHDVAAAGGRAGGEETGRRGGHAVVHDQHGAHRRPQRPEQGRVRGIPVARDDGRASAGGDGAHGRNV
jgi:hypothetical protein